MYTEYQRGGHGHSAASWSNLHAAQPSRTSPRIVSPASFLPSPGPHIHQPARSLRLPPAGQLLESRNPPSPHLSPNPRDPPIKCSSCSAWVNVDDLGDHVCGTSARTAGGPNRGRQEPSGARELRVDVRAAGYAMHGSNTQARSPMYPGHLEPTPPHTPGSSRSRPTSPAHLTSGI